MKRNGWFTALKYLTWLTQLGVSLAMPLILMLLLAGWLVRSVGFGTWIYLPAIILGVGGGVCAFISFAKYMMRQTGGKNASHRK